MKIALDLLALVLFVCSALLASSYVAFVMAYRGEPIVFASPNRPTEGVSLFRLIASLFSLATALMIGVSLSGRCTWIDPAISICGGVSLGVWVWYVGDFFNALGMKTRIAKQSGGESPDPTEPTDEFAHKTSVQHPPDCTCSVCNYFRATEDSAPNKEDVN